jgi:hypothetical protein
LEDSQKTWRACYRHPKKPAIRDCADCGKPICSVCTRESGDPALCPSCKEASEAADRTPEAPVIEIPRVERSPLTVSEVTIHDNGQIEAPAGGKGGALGDDAITTPPTITEEEVSIPDVEPEEPVRRPIVKRRIPKEVKPRARAPVKRVSAKPVQKERKAKREEARKKPGPSTLVKLAPIIKQLKAAFPYGLIAGIGVLGLWLILASIRHSWTQAAVFTMGIAVPWALTKGSTVKKKAGIRVWKGPPHPAWIGLSAAAVMLLLVPLAEFFAYMIVMRGAHLLDPGSKFMSQYFDPTGIFLIVSGFVLAFGVPYVLRMGEGWRAPSEPGRVRERVTKAFKDISRRVSR